MSAGERNEADRVVAEVLAAERDWAWTARSRGESGPAKLCLAAVAAIEAAARRAQVAHCDDELGLYSRRLVDELQARLAEWERRENDEDGYGSSCFYRVIDKLRQGTSERRGEMTDADSDRGDAKAGDLLIEAISAGDRQAVASTLDRGVSVHQADSLGRSRCSSPPATARPTSSLC